MCLWRPIKFTLNRRVKTALNVDRSTRRKAVLHPRRAVTSHPHGGLSHNCSRGETKNGKEGRPSLSAETCGEKWRAPPDDRLAPGSCGHERAVRDRKAGDSVRAPPAGRHRFPLTKPRSIGLSELGKMD